MVSADVVWMNGEFVPFADAKVSVLTHALHYGTGNGPPWGSIARLTYGAGPVLGDAASPVQRGARVVGGRAVPVRAMPDVVARIGLDRQPLDIRDPEDLLNAYELAREICDNCVVEQFIAGHDFRILVIDGHFSAAALREPAFVIGDGG